MKYSLTGIDGNAFCIMGYVSESMSREGYSKSEIDSYITDCMSSDYNHLIQVSNSMCDTLNGKSKDS